MAPDSVPSSATTTTATTTTTTPRIIIAGASFAGLSALRHLDLTKADVVVIEPKDYFEYTPGILRSLALPSHARKLLLPLQESLRGKPCKWKQAWLEEIVAKEKKVGYHLSI